MNIAETRQQLLEDIQHIRETASLEFKTLSEAQLLWKPAPERWGILECLVHLNAASQYYTNQLKLKFSQTPIRSSATDFEMSFNGKMMLGFVEMCIRDRLTKLYSTTTKKITAFGLLTAPIGQVCLLYTS